MELKLPVKTAQNYKSLSQKARVMTETWTLSNMYCPACVANSLNRAPTGTPVVDFFCENCESVFQLKALSKPIGRKIVDAAYDTMIKAILNDRLPHFLILGYNNLTVSVNDLVLIPNFCLPASAIEARKPLAPTARRAGWIGCNIILDLVPPDGRIQIIHSSNIIPKSSVRQKFITALPLAGIASKKRGWTLDVLSLIRSLDKMEFSISDAYSFEKVLSEKHPENRHVKDKIRQQLQILRDLGFLKFTSPGRYCLIESSL